MYAQAGETFRWSNINGGIQESRANRFASPSAHGTRPHTSPSAKAWRHPSLIGTGAGSEESGAAGKGGDVGWWVGGLEGCGVWVVGSGLWDVGLSFSLSDGFQVWVVRGGEEKGGLWVSRGLSVDVLVTNEFSANAQPTLRKPLPPKPPCSYSHVSSFSPHRLLDKILVPGIWSCRVQEDPSRDRCRPPGVLHTRRQGLAIVAYCVLRPYRRSIGPPRLRRTRISSTPCRPSKAHGDPVTWIVSSHPSLLAIRCDWQSSPFAWRGFSRHAA